jgi:hypothetical protein
MVLVHRRVLDGLQPDAATVLTQNHRSQKLSSYTMH